MHGESNIKKVFANVVVCCFRPQILKPLVNTKMSIAAVHEICMAFGK
jgi:hypothetical protein